jgi:ribose 5-phosphate isomerase RpiB
MTNMDKAKLILESIDNYFQINWQFEAEYHKAIVEALSKIERMEKNGW